MLQKCAPYSRHSLSKMNLDRNCSWQIVYHASGTVPSQQVDKTSVQIRLDNLNSS